MYKVLSLDKLKKIEPNATLRDLIIQMKRLNENTMEELNKKYSILSMILKCVKGDFKTKILEWIEKGETIIIIADYDVDGVMSAAIWKEFFDYLGIPVIVLIPNRFKDGYGFGESMLNKVIELNGKHILTCDNGIKSIDTIAKAKKLGIDVIVTDHHQPGDVLPNADVIVNPHCGEQDGINTRDICGAFVSWILVKDLIDDSSLVKSLLELAAVATIADVMPLWKENRTLVKWFIARVRNGENTNIGLDQLIRATEVGRKGFNEESIAFSIAPLINASGRLSDATISYEVFSSKNKEENHAKIMKMVEFNEKRKSYTNISVLNALEQIKKPRDVYCVYLDKCPEGIIGIVAGKLTEKTGKPCFVFTKIHNSDMVKGSGRSPINYNLIEGANKVFSKNPELTAGFGGHSGAMGLSLTSFDAIAKFEKEMIQEYQNTVSIEDGLVKYVIDYPIGMEMEEIEKIISEFAPYGEGFEGIDFYVRSNISNLQVIKDTHTFFDAELNGKVEEFCFFHNIIEAKENHTTKNIIFNINKSIEDNKNVAKYQPYVRDIF